MKNILVLVAGIVVSASAVASDAVDADAMMGPSFKQDEPGNLRRVMDIQAELPARGGELSELLYVRTQERISETFARPMPDRIGESTRDD